ncbi:MAG TPA: hypothetical protein VM925_24420 [Labilithrix sp.]|nr:hypothetical protein [Labilithrix sp.]
MFSSVRVHRDPDTLTPPSVRPGAEGGPELSSIDASAPVVGVVADAG